MSVCKVSVFDKEEETYLFASVIESSFWEY